MSGDKDPKNDEQIPKGAIRKTRRVRKKRKMIETTPDDSPNGLFSKAKEILLGMHDPAEDFGHVDVAEQVRRIKNRKNEEVPLPLDEVWGTKRRSASWLWILLGGAIVSVVVVVIGVTIWLSNEDDGVAANEDDGLDRIGKVELVKIGDGALGWFENQSLEVLAEVREIIGAVNRAKEVKEIEPLIRKSPYRQVNPIRLEDWGSPCVTDSALDFRWITSIVAPLGVADSAGMGVLAVMGKRANLEAYRVYFVWENAGLKLDWDATMGWSEKSIDEIIAEKPSKPIYLRCRVSKKASFDQTFGGTPYSGYVLSGEIDDDFFLAYLDVSSEKGRLIDQGIKRLLNYGSTIGQPLLKNQKGTMVVKFENEVGSEGIFEIVDYLHEGWVSPITVP